MWPADRVLRTLRERGEVWQVAPGLIGLRGDTLRLFRAIESRVAALVRQETQDEWLLPPGIALETLARAEYFASFPQWLTAAAHLSSDPAVLERVANSEAPAVEARANLSAAGAALAPALCYHTYQALAGTRLKDMRVMTAQGTCWRHEGARMSLLERGWAFTMRELVCLGTSDEVERFRQHGIALVSALADDLDLNYVVEVANDPFFAPTARGKALLQRVKALKHELLLPIDASSTIAAASFNHHELFFGEAFDIQTSDGSPAASGCVAFGLERWLLACLVAHGPDAARWPAGLVVNQEINA